MTTQQPAQATRIAPEERLAKAVVTEAPAPGKLSNEEYRKQYVVLHVGMGIPGSAGHATAMKLQALAKQLNVTDTALARFAIEQLVANPPASLPTTVANTARGSSAGFWLIAITTPEGRATGYKIQEVRERGAVKGGKTFHAFQRDDVKSRRRALSQAERNAAQSMREVGLDPSKVVREVFPESTTSAATDTKEAPIGFKAIPTKK